MWIYGGIGASGQGPGAPGGPLKSTALQGPLYRVRVRGSSVPEGGFRGQIISGQGREKRARDLKRERETRERETNIDTPKTRFGHPARASSFDASIKIVRHKLHPRPFIFQD